MFRPKNSHLNELSSEESVDKLLKATIDHNLVKTYPISLKYRQTFIKSLIKETEKHNLKVCETLSTSYALLLSDCNHIQSDYNLNYLSYILSDGQTISLQESDNLVIDGTTGLRSWSAAKHLAKYIESHKQIIENRIVLELGSGIGLTGIYILKTCSPALLTFSDHHSLVLKVLQNNIDINGVRQKSIVRRIDWNQEECLDTYLKQHNPDVIIAADVVFDPKITINLCRVLNSLLVDCNKTRICYICCTHRIDETIDYFRQIITNEYNLEFKRIYFYDQINDLKSFCFDSLNTKCSIFQINAQK